ncbi:MAG: hypothetical protein NVSMB42_15210 [Herpetosiphon sp.]
MHHLKHAVLGDDARTLDQSQGSDLQDFTTLTDPASPELIVPVKLGTHLGPNTTSVAADPVVSATGLRVLYSPDSGVASAALAGGAGSGGTTTVASGSSASPFLINISWDASVSSAPVGFQSAVIAAAQYLESKFADPVTINISVGYGEVNGTALSSGSLGQSLSYLNSYSYSTLRGSLAADATSPQDSSFLASLPSAAPVSGPFWTTSAEAKALGLSSATGTGTDGFVGFSSAYPFTYANSTGVSSGTYDFNGTALHEMTEVMGRLMLAGQTIGSAANSYDLLDMMHYSSAGVRDFSASTPGYSSVDGGQTSLGQFNTAGGDGGDWASSVANDALDAMSASGVVNAFSANDVIEMDALGWNTPSVPAPLPAPTPTPSPAPVPVAPTGVSVTPVTSGIAAAQISTGIIGGAALAKLVEVGGTPGDTFTYSLGGNGASAFVLSTSNNSATLSAAAGGIAAGAGGRLYGLLVTSNDTSNGSSSPARPVDVIVGSSGADTVNVAALTGSLGAATPTFVFGLAGADRIDGTGMTGSLWINGGVGADVMTGGSGANDYIYTSTADSTASAMDVITNFHSGTDAIDLTGLGMSLGVVGKLKTSIAAHSVGWQSSNGNTFVYANVSNSAEGLSTSNMKVELQGSISLAPNNFHHL